ncbi:unnamed protein product [Diabrotica balteata]|uniref:Uncharacterized protein n=1 Tax=Diabrotica balteata TaxID=107213 RepID=A0A9N9SP45_DIABA|nr:unnamed protein product [Diabrotica balteata]
MEWNEDIKDSINHQILTCIKEERDCLKQYNNTEVKPEEEEYHCNNSNRGDPVLDDYCSDDIKIENHILQDVTSEIKVEIKKELEKHMDDIDDKYDKKTNEDFSEAKVQQTDYDT